jgi:hypothetical protein
MSQLAARTFSAKSTFVGFRVTQGDSPTCCRHHTRLTARMKSDFMSTWLRLSWFELRLSPRPVGCELLRHFRLDRRTWRDLGGESDPEPAKVLFVATRAFVFEFSSLEPPKSPSRHHNRKESKQKAVKVCQVGSRSFCDSAAKDDEQVGRSDAIIGRRLGCADKFDLKFALDVCETQLCRQRNDSSQSGKSSSKA